MIHRTDGWVGPSCEVFRVVFVVAVLHATPEVAIAADTGAVGNGDWSNAATWTNGTPGTMDNAYVGSGYPTGAATTATVMLSQNSSAGTVYLGNGSGTTGTLEDRKSTRLNSSHLGISYAVFCLKK